MAKKLLMNTVNNIIDDYNRWLQVFEFSKSFNTINDSRIDEEGKIYIDEIWGNTWQDIDSKNLFDKDNINLITENINDPSSYIVEDNTVKFEIPSSFNQVRIMMKLDRDLDPSKKYYVTYSSYRAFIDGEWVSSDVKKYTSAVKEGNIFMMAFHKEWKPITKFEITDLQISEENVPYEPYHKADLSNIQHVGELYVDEKGQPILDEQDREQYKVEIESTCSNILDKNLFERTVINNGSVNYSFIQEIKGSTLEKDMTYYFKRDKGQNVQCLFYYMDENRNHLQSNYFYTQSTKYKIENRPSNAKYYQIIIRPFGNQHQYNDNVDDFFINHYDIRIGLDNWYEYTPYKPSTKKTILLPCQLMKVGDVKDRLYWDVDEGKYIAEKNVWSFTLDGSETYNHKWSNTVAYTMFSTKLAQQFKHKNSTTCISNKFIGVRSGDLEYNRIQEATALNYDWGSDAKIMIRANTIIGTSMVNTQLVKQWIADNNVLYYYVLETPQLIETNITERIELPCYTPTTHIIVNSGNIEPSSVKTLVPMKILNNVVTDGLICWLESNDLLGLNTIKNGTVWRNRVKNGSNAIIRTIDGSNVDGVKNGLFRTHCKTYVELPSFKTNNNVGMSIFVDGVINKRPSHEYNRVYTLQYNDCHTSGISLNYGYSHFGCTRCFTTNYRSLFDRSLAGPYPIPFSVASSTRIGIGFLNNVKYNYGAIPSYNNTFNNNFLNVESPTSDVGDASYGLVLIYNRDLSEDEMRQNYDYAKSIQRGGN